MQATEMTQTCTVGEMVTNLKCVFHCCDVSILEVMGRIVVKSNTTEVLWCTVHMNESGCHTPIFDHSYCLQSPSLLDHLSLYD